MAVSLQGSSPTGFAATTASVSPANLPTHQADDILLVCAWIRTTTGGLTTPSGWNVVNSGGTVRSTVSRYYWFWKRATSAAETNPVIAVSGGASADKYAQAHVIRGASTVGNPYEAYAVTTGTADPGVATGITSLTDNALIISCGGNEDNVDIQTIITAANAPTAMGTATSTDNRYRTDTGGADAGLWISPGVLKTTAGATGNISHDFNGASRPGWGICVFAFYEQVAPTVALETGNVPATYYFNGSDAAASDPNSAWTNDANAFDGSTSTFAETSTNGSVSSNFLKAEGTNAPTTGGAIVKVRARVYVGSLAGGGTGTVHAAIYTDALAELLGTPNRASATTGAWGNYVTLATPTGGWTWQKVNDLETKIYVVGEIAASNYAFRVEIEVTSVTDPHDFANDTTPTLEFTGTDLNSNDIRYNVQIDTQSDFHFVAGGLASYRFNALHPTDSDPGAAWTNDANVVDNNTATFASTTTTGSTSSNYIRGAGTAAPATGGSITQVRARMWAKDDGSLGERLAVNFYTQNLGESLGSLANGNVASAGGGWSNYVILSTPTGGWTWAKLQLLEFKAYRSAGTQVKELYEVEIEVTSTDTYAGILIDKVSNVDPGFVNTVTSSDTDPYNSGQKIAYTYPGTTFGTASSAGLTTGGLTEIIGTKYVLPSAKTINKLTVYCPTAGNVSGAIYSDNAGVPNTLLVANNTGVAATAGQWVDIPITPTALAAGTYWLTIMGSVNSMRGYKAGNSNQTAYNLSLVYGTAYPSTFPTPSYESNDYVVYATANDGNLAGGTYYWRARGTDPAGSNTYGAWPAGRSFTISTGPPSFTKTHTTNSLLRKKRTRTHTTDSLLRKSPPISHFTNSFFKRRFTRTHTTDTLLRKQVPRLHTTNSLLRKITTRSHTANALLRAIRTRLHTTNSFLRSQRTRTHTTDTLFRKAQTRIHTADSLLRATRTRTHTADSILHKTNSRVHSTDTLFRKAQIRIHTTDAVLRKIATLAHSTDSLIRTGLQTLTRNHSTDTLLTKRHQKNHTTDSFFRARLVRSHTGDTLLRKARTQSHTTDLILRRTTVKAHTSDALLRRARQIVHTTDSHLKGRRTVSHTIDTLLRKATNRQHTADALLRKLRQVVHSTDTLIKSIRTRSHSTDSFLYRRVARTHTSDSLLRKVTNRIHTTNLLARNRLIRSHTSDSFLRARVARTHGTNTLLRKSNNRQHTTNALLRRIGTVAHTTNTLLRVVRTRQHSTDSFFYRRPARTHTADTLLRKVNTRFHFTDLLKRAQALRLHATDALIRANRVRSHTTNSLLRRSAKPTHTVDTFLRARRTRTHTTDSMLSGVIQRNHTTDTFLKSRRVLSHSTNSLLRKQTLVAHATDIMLRKVLTRQHSTDSLLLKKTIVVHSTNALLRAVVVRTHSTNTLLRIRRTIQHSTDTRLIGKGSKTHSTNTYLRARPYKPIKPRPAQQERTKPRGASPPFKPDISGYTTPVRTPHLYAPVSQDLQSTYILMDDLIETMDSPLATMGVMPIHASSQPKIKEMKPKPRLHGTQ